MKVGAVLPKPEDEPSAYIRTYMFLIKKNAAYVSYERNVKHLLKSSQAHMLNS